MPTQLPDLGSRLLTDEDFDSVKVDSSSVMSIEKFVAVNSIDPIYFASSYRLAPDRLVRPTRSDCPEASCWGRALGDEYLPAVPRWRNI